MNSNNKIHFTKNIKTIKKTASYIIGAFNYQDKVYFCIKNTKKEPPFDNDRWFVLPNELLDIILDIVIQNRPAD